MRQDLGLAVFVVGRLILFVVRYIISLDCIMCLCTLRGKYMEYLSIRQTSEKWGISVRRIQVLCSENRIPGATKIGSYWAIPADADKPNDERIKSGKYIKEK